MSAERIPLRVRRKQHAEALRKDEAARAAITYHAKECMQALTLADSEAATSIDPKVPVGLRKLGAMHAHDAFPWAQDIIPAVMG